MVLITVITLIENHYDDAPKEGDFQDIPIHSNDNQDPKRVLDPTMKTSDKQLSETVAELMHKGEKALRQSGGLCWQRSSTSSLETCQEDMFR